MLFGPRREKTCLRGFANNTGADQPAHLCRLGYWFESRFDGNPKDRFSRDEAHLVNAPKSHIYKAYTSGLPLARQKNSISMIFR